MKTKRAFIFGMWVLLSLVLAGCGSKEPILVGFAGELTGKHSELGVAGRNGAQLAVEVINKKLWREITKGLNLPSSITSAAFVRSISA